MKTLLKSTALAASCLALSASFALADTTNPTTASPFGFAPSTEKAEREQKAAEDGSASRIIGGEVAKEGAWPWQVALLIAGRPVQADSQFCGGSLVLDQWILTAAHCLWHVDPNSGPFVLDPRQLTVLAGTNKIAAGLGDNITVTGVFPHPDYDDKNFDNDVALLKIERAPNVTYQTIKIPNDEFGDMLDQEGVPTIVTGWGLLEGRKNPQDMYELEIQMLDRDQCNNAMLEAKATVAGQSFSAAAGALGLTETSTREAWIEMLRRAPASMTENMLCSGTYQGGKTSCQGDSGGPLVVPLKDGSYVQAGIVSWGLSAAETRTCLENAKFSAYTRVSNYLPWISSVVDAN